METFKIVFDFTIVPDLLILHNYYCLLTVWYSITPIMFSLLVICLIWFDKDFLSAGEEHCWLARFLLQDLLVSYYLYVSFYTIESRCIVNVRRWCMDNAWLTLIPI